MSSAVRFVLVEPARAVNIGAAARAIKTMGFDRLDLVASRVPITDPHVRAVAHGAGEVLDSARHHETIATALEGCDLVIGTTGRRRGHIHDYRQPDELAGFIRERASSCAIVFGSEESGLSNEHLRYCQVVSAIPMHRPHPSINLAQAVMVYAYELRTLAQERQLRQTTEANPLSVTALAQRIDRTLPLLGFDPGRALFNRMRERALQASADDLALLHSLLYAVEKRLDRTPD